MIVRSVMFAVFCLAAVAAPATDSETIRLLIVTGYDHPAHDWKTTTPAIRAVLEKDPRFEVRVVEDPQRLAMPELADYDVVVLHFMNWQRPGPKADALENLCGFVRDGKGLVVVHFACGAFAESPEYRQLAGRVWDGKNSHDPRGPFRVEILDREHPITRGMESYDTDDELYICLTGDRPIENLASARSRVTGQDHPMAFCCEYGKGRVFHTTLGHDARAIRVPGTAELIRRGSAWAAGREPVVERSDRR